VFLAVAPGFGALADLVMRGLVVAGAVTVLESSGGDDSALAAEANQFEADLFFAVRAGDEPGSRCCYYASGAFRSEAGFRVATAVSSTLQTVLQVEVEVCGRRHTALRETRMAAVLCEPAAHDDVAGTRRLVTTGAAVAQAIVAGIRRGVEEPTETD
jgi:N-acetylmuramoyl-L-alanine amidase